MTARKEADVASTSGLAAVLVGRPVAAGIRAFARRCRSRLGGTARIVGRLVADGLTNTDRHRRAKQRGDAEDGEQSCDGVWHRFLRHQLVSDATHENSVFVPHIVKRGAMWRQVAS
jgi:hypothetical protein